MHFSVKDDEGAQLYEGHLVYLHGHGNLLAAVERELTGMRIGERKKFRLSPEEGYGNYNQELLGVLPYEVFPTDQRIDVGMVFELHTKERVLLLQIKELRENGVLVDANHPLAGKHLNFDVTIEGVRPASAIEMEHGHAHDFLEKPCEDT